jgi:hypothetical protein
VVGTPGTGGSQGGSGSTGTDGTDAASQQDIITLLGLIQGQSAVIDELTGQLDALGVDVNSLIGEVDGLQGILSGVTNGELQSAIDSVPAVTALCDQVADVTDQSDALRSALSVISTLLDPLTLGVLPALPAALGTFSCA